jgi:hypothetical protein
MNGMTDRRDQYPRHPAVTVTITTPAREVLDRFQVANFRSREKSYIRDDDAEGVGSHASRALLSERIERYIQEPTA